MEEKGQNSIGGVRTKPDVFYTNPKYEYLLSRIKKIVFASYMLTDLIKDTESLKNDLRNIANKSVESACLLHKEGFQVIKEKLLVLKTFFEVGLVSKIVSVMNAEVIIKEIVKVLEEIALEELECSKKMTLTGETFLVAKAEESKQIFSLESNYPLDFLNKRDDDLTGGSPYKGHNNVLYKHGVKNDFYTNSRVSKNNIKDNFLKSKNIDSNNSSGNLNKQREERIISIIKDKKEVSIKDISTLITNCSEKTIQRDLTDMLEKGLLKKTGERRWSRYSMA